jgi:hypothetical protein
MLAGKCFSLTCAEHSGAGIPTDSIMEYETALKAAKFLVIAHGA